MTLTEPDDGLGCVCRVLCRLGRLSGQVLQVYGLPAYDAYRGKPVLPGQ